MAGMSAMEARRRILLNTPHVEPAVPAGIAAFSTSLSAPLKTCRAYFGPVQEGGGDPGPENVRPISGRTGLICHVAGANLLNPDAYAVSWAEEAGTVYGGYVDLATGELAAEYARIAVSTANTTVRAGETDAPGYGYPYGRYMRTVLDGGFRPFASANATCNALSLVGTYNAFINGATGYFIPSAAPNVYWLHPDCATEEGANALRSADIHFAFMLATPFRTQLSPQKVRTLKGANRVWSDAGGEMQVKYWTH